MDIRLGVIVDGAKAIAGSKQVGNALNFMSRKARATQAVFRSMTQNVRSLGRTLFSLKTAIAAVGLGLLVRSFITAASVTEQFQVRLQVLLGSVQEGKRLFEEMSAFAGRVPFEFEHVMGAATQLSGVMRGGVEEIKTWMPLIGDLAAVSGLTLQQTTEQVIRMYSAGAASADLFRERGITAMLGFQMGVSVSAEETRKRLMESWKKTDSQFRGATGLLAQTWTGTMSMLSDKWFQFRNNIMEGGLFDYIKATARTIDEEIGNALGGSKEAGKRISDTIIETFESLLIGTASLIDTITPLLSSITTVIGRLYDGFMALPPWIREIGIMGALLFGKKGKVALIALSATGEHVANVIEATSHMMEGRMSVSNWLAFKSGDTKQLDRIREQVKNTTGIIRRDAASTQADLDHLAQSAGGGSLFEVILGKDYKEESTAASDAVKKVLDAIRKNMAKLQKAREDAAGRVKLTGTGSAIQVTKEETSAFNNMRNRIDEVYAANQRLGSEMGALNKQMAAGNITVEQHTSLMDKLKDEYQEGTEAYKAMIKRQEESKKLLKEIRTPTEQFRDELIKINKLAREFGWTNEQLDRAVAKSWEGISNTAKKTTDEMTEFMKEAARNMENAMGDFFFDIMQGNMTDLGNSFKRMLDRMVADSLAAQLAEKLMPGMKNGGTGSIIGNLARGAAGMFSGGASTAASSGATAASTNLSSSPFFVNLAGAANGADFMVGGSGGIDSQVVAFKATPNEKVSVTTPRQRRGSGGGDTVNMNFAISTPTGNVSREAQSQISDSAYRGMKEFHRRLS